jgi:hypothetical protein
MPDSQDRRKARRTAGKPAGKTAGTTDPGHERARRISAERNEVKAHGSASAKVYGRGTAAEPRRETDERTPEAAAGTGSAPGPAARTDAERLRRRARFLRERNEARELRERVQPRRTRSARMRQALRMRTFRW